MTYNTRITSYYSRYTSTPTSLTCDQSKSIVKLGRKATGQDVQILNGVIIISEIDDSGAAGWYDRYAYPVFQLLFFFAFSFAGSYPTVLQNVRDTSHIIRVTARWCGGYWLALTCYYYTVLGSRRRVDLVGNEDLEGQVRRK